MAFRNQEHIMGTDPDRTRRGFLRASAIVGVGLFASGRAPAGARGPTTEPKDGEQPRGSGEDVSPAEDLMREHGVLKRVLLVYGEAIRRLDAKEDLPPEVVADAAAIIRTFIEDYHERLEEDFLFPRFRKAAMHVDLVEVLATQHHAGRRVTETAMNLAKLRSLHDPDDCRRLTDSLRAFIRMYEPHEAREDTVLSPALPKIVTPREYDALGEEFEKKEHGLFGEEGFEQMVDRVATIERKLGIYELAQFTPP